MINYIYMLDISQIDFINWNPASTTNYFINSNGMLFRNLFENQGVISKYELTAMLLPGPNISVFKQISHQ